MRRKLPILCALLGLCLATAFYLRAGSGPEAKRRYLKQAREYLAQGKVNESVIMFKNALKADPESAEAHHELGLALLKKGDIAEAFRELRRAARLKPDLIPARYQLGDLYLLRGEIPRAKEQVEKIREQDADSLEARYLAAKIALAERDPDRALKELQEVLAKGTERKSVDIAMAYVSVGKVHAVKRGFKAAERAYRKALDIQPSLIEARIALANLYFSLDERAKAEEELLLAQKGDPENEALVHLLGGFYSRTDRLDQYEKLYRDLLRRKPSSLVAKKALAELFLMKGELQQAKAYIQAIFKAQPNGRDSRYLRGRLYLAEGRHEKAIEDFSSVTRHVPRFAPAFYYLAVAQLQTNQIQQAKGSLLKAAGLSPSWLRPRLTLAGLHLALGDHHLALEESEGILELHPDNPRALLIAGAAQMRKGNFGEALKRFQKARKLNPKDPIPYINLGAVHLLRKNYALALREYEEALRLDPDKVEALGSIARIHVMQGSREAALERVRQQLKKARNPAAVYQLLGELRLEGKEYGKAIEHLEKAVHLNPDLLPAYFLIGKAYFAQREFDSAIEQYQKVIQKEPRAVPAYMLLGVIYDLKEDHAEANRYYQKILDRDKNFAPAANNLAWNYAEYGGNLDIALGLAQKAREHNSESPHIADTLGWIYYKKAAYMSALALLKESNEKFQNNNLLVLYHLGMANLKLGNRKAAGQALARAVRLSSSFPGVEEAKKTLEEIGTE